ncbi:hypothetical protein SDIAM103S_02003 [Streptomyces diastaticus subsp. diastaticus]
MSPRHEIPRTARARAFATFAAGAGGRLLHLAALLTAEPPDKAPYARRLLTAALARAYADWDASRDDDPYERARQHLVTRYARSAWHRRLAPAGLRAPARSGRSPRANGSRWCSGCTRESPRSRRPRCSDCPSNGSGR